MELVEFQSKVVARGSTDRLFVCAYCCYRFRSSSSTERGSRLQRCRGCKIVRYCSLEHHRAHWPLHRKFCRVYNANNTTSSERVFMRMLFPVYMPVHCIYYTEINYHTDMRHLLHQMVRTYQGGLVTVPLLDSSDDAFRVFVTLFCVHETMTRVYPALVGKLLLQFYYVFDQEVNHLVFGVGITYSNLLKHREEYNQMLKSRCLFRLDVVYATIFGRYGYR